MADDSEGWMQLPATSVRAALGVMAVGLTAVEFMPLALGRSLFEITFLATHLGAALSATFLIFGPRARRGLDDSIPLADFLLAAVALACAIYFILQGPRIAERIEGVDPVYTADLVFGSVLIVLLLEACRRATSAILAFIAAIFIAYMFVGPYLPDLLAYRGMRFDRFIDLQVLSTQAIFGSPISASAYMVFYFVLVGAFLERSGAGQLFVDLAFCVTGRAWGGAAKASVVSSGLFGMISGSAIANVLVNGIVSIPMMKREGFSPSMAGAVEATSSTGGQLAPPIMGAAAFILADVVGVPYADVVVAAIVPAILFYLSIYVVVDSYSRRRGLAPTAVLPVQESLAGLRVRWHLLLPLLLMIYLLLSQYSLMLTGAVTLVAIIVVSWARTATRMGLGTIYAAILQGLRATVEIAIPSATAGIIVGTLVQTGMALNLQSWLLEMAGNSLFLSLVGTMLLTIIFGMGMPTAAAYLVSAILVAPALQQLGVPALVAHMFIFYFAILSMVTPPVALAAYAAAGLSGANLWNCGWLSFLIALPGFLIPFAFVADPGILLQRDLVDAAGVIAMATIGVIALSAATGGYLLGPLSIPARLLLFCFAPLLIDPRLITDLIGGAGLVGILAYQFWRYRLAKPAAAQPAGP
jgi:TRAP transporter 4TM/12TM fusion protein